MIVNADDDQGRAAAIDFCLEQRGAQSGKIWKSTGFKPVQPYTVAAMSLLPAVIATEAWQVMTKEELVCRYYELLDIFIEKGQS